MSQIHDQIANGVYSHAAGTSGTVTVPSGMTVVGLSAFTAAGGTITITPKGPGQSQTAQTAITLPANSGWFHAPTNVFLGQLGAGTTIAFASTDAYVVYYTKMGRP